MSESKEQAALMQWLSMQYPHAYSLTFAIPNGGSRHKLEAVKMKREGVKAGVPDLFMAVPAGIFSGLFIEYKTIKGSLQSNQKEWLQKLNDSGYLAVCCKGTDEAMTLISSYLHK